MVETVQTEEESLEVTLDENNDVVQEEKSKVPNLDMKWCFIADSIEAIC